MPPRCTCPRIVVRISKPSSFLFSLNQRLSDAASIRRALGHHDERVRLAALVRVRDLGRDRFGVARDLRNADRLRAAGDAGHQTEVAAVPAHHLDERAAPMRRRRHAQPVDRLERDVERGVEADRDVRAAEVVVDRRRGRRRRARRASTGRASPPASRCRR
jgi:hypothetical protein